MILKTIGVLVLVTAVRQARRSYLQCPTTGAFPPDCPEARMTLASVFGACASLLFFVLPDSHAIGAMIIVAGGGVATLVGAWHCLTSKDGEWKAEAFALSLGGLIVSLITIFILHYPFQ